jgi:hypothetical protein
VSVTTADRELLGVEMLQQCLRELARGAELVPQLRQRHRTAVSVGDREQPATNAGQHVRVVVQRL